MAKKDAIPVSYTEAPIQAAGGRRGNVITRRPKASAIVGAFAVVAGLAAGAANFLRDEPAPRVGVFTTLADCSKGQKDTSPQPSEYFTGQMITIGLGEKTLSHTVTLRMMEGGLLQQEHVDEGVKLVAKVASSSELQQPSGLEMTYTLGEETQVTLTSYPGTGKTPLLTPVFATRSC